MADRDPIPAIEARDGFGVYQAALEAALEAAFEQAMIDQGLLGLFTAAVAYDPTFNVYKVKITKNY